MINRISVRVLESGVSSLKLTKGLLSHRPCDESPSSQILDLPLSNVEGHCPTPHLSCPCRQCASVPSKEIGWEEPLRRDLFCVEWVVKPQLKVRDGEYEGLGATNPRFFFGLSDIDKPHKSGKKNMKTVYEFLPFQPLSGSLNSLQNTENGENVVPPLGVQGLKSSQLWGLHPQGPSYRLMHLNSGATYACPLFCLPVISSYRVWRVLSPDGFPYGICQDNILVDAPCCTRELMLMAFTLLIGCHEDSTSTGVEELRDAKPVIHWWMKKG